ncbi:MAG: 4Fe-4S dicluster domain-containing protein, partial [Pyrobaculum sp.]
MKYAMLIDLRRCIGCRACMAVCAQENSALFDYRSEDAGVWLTKWAVGELDNYNLRILEVHKGGVVQYISLSCMHCENPPCVAVCPTGASYKDKNGIVKIDYQKCVGCKACMAACPYGARYVRKTAKSYPLPAPVGVVDK